MGAWASVRCLTPRSKQSALLSPPPILPLTPRLAPMHHCLTSRRECNHEYAGASADAPELPQGVKGGGFMITKNRKKARRCRCRSLPPPLRAIAGGSPLRQPAAAPVCLSPRLTAGCHPRPPPLLFRCVAVQIGEGKKVFDEAVRAVKSWDHLQLGEQAALGCPAAPHVARWAAALGGTPRAPAAPQRAGWGRPTLCRHAVTGLLLLPAGCRRVELHH